MVVFGGLVERPTAPFVEADRFRALFQTSVEQQFRVALDDASVASALRSEDAVDRHRAVNPSSPLIG